MKHAILIIAYHQADFIKQCIDNFDDDFLVFIHWDKRAELTEADRNMLVRHPRVRFLGKDYPVNWGSYGLVRVTLRLCREAMKHGDVKYFHLISDADMPTRNAACFKHFFQIHQGESFMEYGKYNSESGTFNEEHFQKMTLFHRTEKYNLRNPEEHRRYAAELEEQRKSDKRRPLPDIPVYGGPAWWSLTRECVTYLLEKEDYIEQVYTETLIPDEMFTQTLLMNSPFASTIVNKHLRYICWEQRNGNRPAVLDKSDFARVLRGDFFFARKVDPEGVSKSFVRLVDDICLHTPFIVDVEKDTWDSLLDKLHTFLYAKQDIYKVRGYQYGTIGTWIFLYLHGKLRHSPFNLPTYLKQTAEVWEEYLDTENSSDECGFLGMAACVEYLYQYMDCSLLDVALDEVNDYAYNYLCNVRPEDSDEKWSASFQTYFHFLERNGRLTEDDRKVLKTQEAKEPCTSSSWTFSHPGEVAERMNRVCSLGLSGYAGLGLVLLAKATSKEQTDWLPLLDLIPQP
ncbi:MAG: beta-1,6-N-acetylglucosaminyltransferase [Paraprevotella sp.]|nr:beta-1,6-N-acetylglucosaminyltransferase [Paraprevotella sp.]